MSKTDMKCEKNTIEDKPNNSELMIEIKSDHGIISAHDSSDYEKSPSSQTKNSSFDSIFYSRKHFIRRRRSLQQFTFPNISYPELGSPFTLKFSPLPVETFEEDKSEDSYGSKKNTSRSFHSEKYFKDKRDLIEDMFNLRTRNTAEIIEEMSKEPTELKTVKESDEENLPKEESKIVVTLHDLSKDLKNQMRFLSDYFDEFNPQRPQLANVVNEDDRISENDSEYDENSSCENRSTKSGSILKLNKPEFFMDNTEPVFKYSNLVKLKHFKFRLKPSMKETDSIKEESCESDIFNDKGLTTALGILRKSHAKANFVNNLMMYFLFRLDSALGNDVPQIRRIRSHSVHDIIYESFEN